MRQPNCIHVPVLRWGKPARIVWADLETAERYVLQRRLADKDEVFPDSFTTICDGEHFSVASAVYVWETIDSADVTWNLVSEYLLPWSEINALCAGDRYFAHAAHNTHNWKTIDASGRTWSMVSDRRHSWRAIRSIVGPPAHVGFDDFIPKEQFFVPSDAYVWETIDSAGVNWNTVAEHSLPWRKIGSLLAGKLYSIYTARNWEVIDASETTWDMVSEYRYLWSAIRSILGSMEYVAVGVDLAEYRLTVYYQSGESETISSGILPVLGDDFEDSIDRIVTAGVSETFQINARGMTAMDKLLRIAFDREEPELEDYYSGRLEPVSQDGGELVFRLTKDLPEETEWAGLVIVLRFNALRSGEFRICMETTDVN